MSEHEGLVAPSVPTVRVSAPSGATFFGVKCSQNQLVGVGSSSIVVVGIVLGFAFTPPSADPPPWDRLSAIIGWWYFTAWAVSFLPQLYLNYTRKCVVGQSFDYVVLNVLGFTSYSIYNVAFYAVPSVQRDYRDRFGNDNNVELNDVGFAVYATLLVLINSWQIVVYERGAQRVARWVQLLVATTLLLFVVWLCVLLYGFHTTVFFNTLDLLYGLSIVKLAVSLIKYLPQLYLNYQRQSTIGWNIWNVLLDFTGGFLSVTQQLIDCGTTGRWNGIVGNGAKFALGSFSMVYDVAFVVQHFVLYRQNSRRQQERDAAAHRLDDAATWPPNTTATTTVAATSAGDNINSASMHSIAAT